MGSSFLSALKIIESNQTHRTLICFSK